MVAAADDDATVVSPLVGARGIVAVAIAAVVDSDPAADDDVRNCCKQHYLLQTDRSRTDSGKALAEAFALAVVDHRSMDRSGSKKNHRLLVVVLVVVADDGGDHSSRCCCCCGGYYYYCGGIVVVDRHCCIDRWSKCCGCHNSDPHSLHHCTDAEGDEAAAAAADEADESMAGRSTMNM